MSKITVSYLANNIAKKVDGEVKWFRHNPKNLTVKTDFGNYVDFAGGKGYEYNNRIMLDTKTGLKALENLVKSYVHSVVAYKSEEDNGKYRRCAAGFFKSNCFFWDFDNKGKHTDLTIDEFKASEFGKTHEWVMYASKSHTDEENCFHVLVPLETMFTEGQANLYKEASKYTASSYGIKCDNTFDAARQIKPGRKPNCKPSDTFFFEHHDGETLNVDMLKEELIKINNKKEQDAKDMAEAYEKRRAEAKVVSTKRRSKKVQYGLINNPYGQVKAIIAKRFGHPELDRFLDDIADDICNEISETEYAAWIEIGYAIKRYAGEGGRSLWINFCHNGINYNEKDDNKYDTFTVDQDYAIQPLMKLAENLNWDINMSLASDIIGWDRDIKRREEDAKYNLTTSELESVKKLTESFGKEN